MTAAPAVAPGAFSIAVIPDTQNEVFGGDQRFANRTQWLVNNRSALNLAFVLHTGDMMNWDTADHAQYAVARSAMGKLDAAGIPWIPAIGNHDTRGRLPGRLGLPEPVRARQPAAHRDVQPVLPLVAILLRWTALFECGRSTTPGAPSPPGRGLAGAEPGIVAAAPGDLLGA